MNKIANYDTLDYDYSNYWKNRDYEHKSEEIALSKLLTDSKGKWFLDIGGSYGRLTQLYNDKYTKPIIVDYSLKTLQRNYKHLKDNYPNVKLIAANAYYLPFNKDSFDGALMVRVLHHLDTPSLYFKEVSRILKPNSVYIQEFANKAHLKAILKSLLKLNFSVFNKEPYQQPTKNYFEGARKGAHVPFYNYHPVWIKEQLNKNSLSFERKLGCSFFRSNALKRIFGANLLLTFERIFQKTFSWSNISPSIFIKSVRKNGGKSVDYNDIKSLLVCPKCKSKLTFLTKEALCKACNEKYFKKKNIWDFRI
jgi:ubiquinone/menaquinone biosynthesis C-methylase UbiE